MERPVATLDFQHAVTAGGVPSPRTDIDMALVRGCIHCGLCLPKCPTFRVLHHEGDSPRGRVWQIKEANLGLVAFDDPRFQTHIYQCFNCRACETACPSGVQFGGIMEMARAHTPPQNRRDRLVRAILLNGLLPHRGRMAAAGAAFRTVQVLRVPAFLRATGLWRVLPLGKFAAFPPPVERSPLPVGLPEVMPAQGTRRARVGLLTGCIQDQLFRSTNRRTAVALATNGCEVVIPKDQLCCGALASHAGEAETAAQLAAHTLDVFTRAGVDTVVVNAAGCGSNMKEYGLQLRTNPLKQQAGEVFAHMVRDASEYLATLGPLRAPNRGIKLRVAYQDACHLLHGQRIARQPREMLAAIPGIELVDLKEADWCCGSAGVYNLTHPGIAEAALAWKVEHILESGAEVVASANPGCIMQIAMGLQRAGHDIPVVHVMDLLGWAYGDPGPAPRLIAQRFTT